MKKAKFVWERLFLYLKAAIAKSAWRRLYTCEEFGIAEARLGALCSREQLWGRQIHPHRTDVLFVTGSCGANSSTVFEIGFFWIWEQSILGKWQALRRFNKAAIFCRNAKPGKIWAVKQQPINWKRDKKSDFEKENWDKNVKGFGVGNSSPFTFI